MGQSVWPRIDVKGNFAVPRVAFCELVIKWLGLAVVVVWGEDDILDKHICTVVVAREAVNRL